MLGETGCGKTTFINTLFDLEPEVPGILANDTRTFHINDKNYFGSWHFSWDLEITGDGQEISIKIIDTPGFSMELNQNEAYFIATKA